MSIAPVMRLQPQADNALLERLGRLFVRVLGTEVPSADGDLIDSGILDSLALVSLVLEIETEFGLNISYDELEIDHFRTLRSIAAFITDGQRRASR